MLNVSSHRKLAVAVVALLLGPVGASVSLAGSSPQSTTMTINATVGNSCAFGTVTPVAFGTFATGTQSTATGSFQLNCTAGTVTTISISAGAGVGHTTGTDTRAMTAPGAVGASNFLSYDLFQDAAFAHVWGTGGNALSGASTVGQGSAVLFQVFGRIQSATTAPSGTYTDTVTITATF